MAELDNVPTEKIDLNFSEDLGNQFGIEDTQTIAGENLKSFLFGGDPETVTKVEDQKPEQVATPIPEPVKKEEVKTPTPQEIEENKKKAFEKSLFKDEEGEGDENKTPEGNKTPEAPADDAQDNEVYSSLGKSLMKLGVFTKNSEDETEETLKIESPEDFLERFKFEKKKGAVEILDNFLGQHGEDYRRAFDAIFVNGVNPTEYLSAFARVETVANLDLTSEDNQAKVVREYYKGLKWDDAKIEGRISKLKDYGDLEEEAKTYHDVLLTREKEKENQLVSQKAEENKAREAKEVAAKASYERILQQKLKEREIDGIPLTDKDASDVLRYISDKPYKLPSGELLTEFDKFVLELNRPENHELKLKAGLLFMKKLDMSSVKKSSISKKNEALFDLTVKNSKNKQEKKEQKSFFG